VIALLATESDNVTESLDLVDGAVIELHGLLNEKATLWLEECST